MENKKEHLGDIKNLNIDFENFSMLEIEVVHEKKSGDLIREKFIFKEVNYCNINLQAFPHEIYGYSKLDKENVSIPGFSKKLLEGKEVYELEFELSSKVIVVCQKFEIKEIEKLDPKKYWKEN